MTKWGLNYVYKAFDQEHRDSNFSIISYKTNILCRFDGNHMKHVATTVLFSWKGPCDKFGSQIIQLNFFFNQKIFIASLMTIK
jgi:hypothetical protein